MKDANDILREDGVEALRAEFDNMKPFEPEQRHANGNGKRVDAPSLQPKLAATTATARRVPWTIPAMQWRDPATIPIRKFLYGYCYARSFVSATIADSGMGKSSLKIAEFLACATGLPLLGITPTE